MKRARTLRQIGLPVLSLLVVAAALNGGFVLGSGDGAEVGICVIGVDSPCNGEQWDGDGDRSTDHDSSGLLDGIDVIGEDFPARLVMSAGPVTN